MGQVYFHNYTLDVLLFLCSYKKFTKGKDLSSRNQEDLACVFGKRKSKSEGNTPLVQSEVCNKQKHNRTELKPGLSPPKEGPLPALLPLASVSGQSWSCVTQVVNKVVSPSRFGSPSWSYPFLG